MLRVGLTGELGSGKSTVARLLAGLGAVVVSSDEMGRTLMQPGTPVYDAIVRAFGPDVVLAGGQLDRAALARQAFDPAHPRVEELNALVHPAVIAEQEGRIAEFARLDPRGIVVVESALLLTTRHAGGVEPWRRRFDRIVLVTAPEVLKIERFVQRSAEKKALSAAERLEAQREAARRLAAQRLPTPSIPDLLVIENAGSFEALRQRTAEVYRELQAGARGQKEHHAG